jgi:hypothetical protein
MPPAKRVRESEDVDNTNADCIALENSSSASRSPTSSTGILEIIEAIETAEQHRHEEIMDAIALLKRSMGGSDMAQDMSVKTLNTYEEPGPTGQGPRDPLVPLVRHGYPSSGILAHSILSQILHAIFGQSDLGGDVATDSKASVVPMSLVRRRLRRVIARKAVEVLMGKLR